MMHAHSATSIMLMAAAQFVILSMPMVRLVTAGGREITNVAGMRAAAQDLRAKGAALVLVKGGHLAGANGRAVDVACDGDGLEELESEVVR